MTMVCAPPIFTEQGYPGCDDPTLQWQWEARNTGGIGCVGVPPLERRKERRPPMLWSLLPSSLWLPLYPTVQVHSKQHASSCTFKFLVHGANPQVSPQPRHNPVREVKDAFAWMCWLWADVWRAAASCEGMSVLVHQIPPGWQHICKSSY